jgi:DNA-binding NtrC family response regulator
MASSDKILLVEDHPSIIEMLVEAFVRQFDANITCVPTAEDALDVAMVERHSVVVTETALPGMDGIALARQMLDLGGIPVILMDDDPDAAEVIAAMRAGVMDFFVKPFRVEDLLESVDRAIHAYHKACRMIRRQERLRDLSRRVVRERRELKERVELVCRDLVGAHKRLVLRVIENESALGVQPS